MMLVLFDFWMDVDLVYLSFVLMYYIVLLVWMMSVLVVGVIIVVMEKFDVEGVFDVIQCYWVIYV